ncbi:MAG: hypothetical protein HQL93_08815 [Magnetococcales bacterium]|nr:hypothetical protein [Magnetococcales bacterium]
MSFETPLQFIFSHSALREGWDNPNVFQICVLRDMSTEMTRRQSIGRGLRLCVNQSGERLHDSSLNTLTVIATESFEQFAATLQQEIEQENGIRFGMVEKHQFANIPLPQADGSTIPLGIDASKALWNHLQATGYLDAKGKVQETLRHALREESLVLPESFLSCQRPVEAILRKLAGKFNIKNADERVKIQTRKAVLHSEAFKALWQRIRHKTTYRVAFDNERLVANCAQAILHGPAITQACVQVRKADLAIGKGGVEARETTQSAPILIDEYDIELPDLLTVLQDQTQLTRVSIVRILRDSGRLGDFRRNPQQFIELASEAIQRAKRLALVDGIRYQRIGDDHFWAQELFEQEELSGYLKELLKDTKKSVYEHVVYDSEGVERTFAEQLEKNEAVRVYAKLPSWFKIPTPLGSYNPDWAVLVESEGAERIYFVVETKGSLFAEDLREKENAKIACGRSHFQALAAKNDPARFVVAKNVNDMMGHI